MNVTEVRDAPTRSRRRRRVEQVVQLVPVIVPLSMGALFTVLKARLPAHRAYNVGFAAYWTLWCYAFPLAVVGPERALTLLRTGRRLTRLDAVLLLLPVAGAVGTALLPNARRVDRSTAAVMLGTATVNAVGEELLWRGVFLDTFPDDPVRGAVWPLLGFSLWHLAPQIILPSRYGRWRFVGGATVVGAASAVVAWRGNGLRDTVLPHLATDACGVVAAEFRLGR